MKLVHPNPREAALLFRRPLVFALLLAGFVIACVTAARPTVTSPYGVTGSVFFITDGNLTYGLGIAVLLGVAVAAPIVALGDTLHAHGLSRTARVERALMLGIMSSVIARLVTVLALMLGGAIDGIHRGHLVFGSVIHQSGGEIFRGQLRSLGLYILAGALGVLIMSAVRRMVPALVVAAALVAVYLPVVGAISNRVPKALGVLPYLPFGSLRAAFLGNGAILGDDPSQARFVSVGVGTICLVGWLVALHLLSINTIGGQGLEDHVRPIALFAVSGVGAGLLAATLPGALSAHIPWQWRPSWRDAEAHGWDSRQVAARWSGSFHTASAEALAGNYVADPKTTSDLAPAVVQVLRNATAVTVAPTQAMHGPSPVSVLLTLSPPMTSGNVRVDEAELQLSFVYRSGRWLIAKVEGPSLHAVVLP